MERTHRNTLKVQRIADGMVIEREPPDAHELVRSGAYRYVSAATPSIYDHLLAHTAAEFTDLARQTVGRVALTATRAEMVDALLPHVESGLITVAHRCEVVAPSVAPVVRPPRSDVAAAGPQWIPFF